MSATAKIMLELIAAKAQCEAANLWAAAIVIEYEIKMRALTLLGTD